MDILRRVIWALIYLCIIVLAFYLVIWVLGALGIVIPAMAITIFKIILALIAILVIVQLFWPIIVSSGWGPPR